MPMRSLTLLTFVLLACSGPEKGFDRTPRGSAGSAAAGAGSSARAGSGGRASGAAGADPAGVGGRMVAAGGASAAASAGSSQAGTSAGGSSGEAGVGAAGGATALGGMGASLSGAGGTAGGGRGGAAGSAVTAGRGGRVNSTGGTASGGRSADSAGAGATANITVWLSGDSTMANGETPCPVGWGKMFKPYFNDKVTVTNSAVGGRSIHTWLYSVQDTMDQSGECVLAVDGNGDPTLQARWTQMLSGMKAGDYLFVQFGINDGDPTCDRHVGLDAFKESLGMMAQAAKDHGTQPIFATPVSAIACTGSTARGTRGEYVTATLEAGKEFDVPVIDLHALSVALYQSLGFCPIPGGDVSSSTTGPVGDFFCDDHTHFESSGATAIAGLIAQALRDQRLGLAGYLK